MLSPNLYVREKSILNKIISKMTPYLKKFHFMSERWL